MSLYHTLTTYTTSNSKGRKIRIKQKPIKPNDMENSVQNRVQVKYW